MSAWTAPISSGGYKCVIRLCFDCFYRACCGSNSISLGWLDAQFPHRKATNAFSIRQYTAARNVTTSQPETAVQYTVEDARKLSCVLHCSFFWFVCVSLLSSTRYTPVHVAQHFQEQTCWCSKVAGRHHRTENSAAGKPSNFLLLFVVVVVDT